MPNGHFLVKLTFDVLSNFAYINGFSHEFVSDWKKGFIG